MANECSGRQTRRAARVPILQALGWVALLAATSAAADVQSTDPVARVGLTISAPAGRLEPASTTRYLVRVENTGGSQHGARLVVASPEGLVNSAWTCASSAGATCTHASGTGDLDESLDGLVEGSALEFQVDASVDALPPAFVRLAASTSLPTGARCARGETPPCHSTLSLPTGPALLMSVDSSAPALSPGQRVVYTIRVGTGSARSSTAGTVLRSPVPKGLTNSSWTCQSASGACQAASGSGGIEQVLGDFSASEVRFQVTSTVAANPPGTIVQAAVAIPPSGGSCVSGPEPSAPSVSAPCAARMALATRPQIFASRTPDYSLDGLTVANRLILENRGTSANGSRISLALPTGVSSMTWTCVARGATCPQASGSGPFEQTIASWPTSGVIQYDVVSRRVSAQAGVSDLRMTVVPPAHGSCGAAELAPPCPVLSAAKIENGFLRISQVADRLGARAGDELHFTVTLDNDSTESIARNLVLDVPVPAGIEAFRSWTCSAPGSAGQCPVASGNGAIRQVIAEMVPSARLVYDIVARIGDSAPATITSMASLIAPAESSLGCRNAKGAPGPCVALTELASVPVLSLEQSRLAGNFSSGGNAGYTLDVFNFGADGSNVRIDNAIPKGLASTSWTCTGYGVGCPTANGIGKVAAALTQMPLGSGLHFEVAGRFSGNPPDTISNILTAIPTAGGRCHRGASDSLSPAPCMERTETRMQPTFELTQSASEHQLLVGGVAHYLVSLKNLGSLANGALLNVPLPEGIDHFDWTCTGLAGAVCPTVSSSGPIDEAIASLPSDGTLNYAIRAVLAAEPTTSVTSLATVTPPQNGRCLDDSCTASTSLPLAAVPSAHLDVALKPARAWAPPGSDPTWTIDIRNLGSEVATDVHVENPLPEDGLTIVSWTCAGVECPAGQGTGPINEVVGSLAVYDANSNETTVAPGRIVFTMVGHVDANAGPEVSLAANVTPSHGDTCAPVSCQAAVPLPTSLRGAADVTIDLQADTFTATPNSTINYTLTLIVNSGIGAIDFDVFTVQPSQIASSTWTCVGGGGGTCPASGSGPINVTLSAMPSGSTATFSIAAQTGSNVQPSVDFLAGVNVASGIFCTPASCTNTLSIPGEDELTLTLNADVSQIVPGGSVQYTYRVQNTGGGNQFGIQLFTVEPPGLASSSWTCVAAGGAFCTPSGTGPIVDLISSIPIGASITYTIDAIAASTLPPTIDFQGGAAFGGQPGQVSAPDGVLGCVPASCLVTLSLPTVAPTPPRLSISKTADRGTLDPGGNVRYTITIVNTGSQDATSVQFSDAIPNGLSSFAWTCNATGDAFCPQSSGTGPINETFSFVPIASSLTYTVDATVSATASGSVSNRAQLVASNISCTPSSCQAVSALPVGQAAALSVTKTALPASGTPIGAGQPIAWTVLASNSGGPTRAPLVLTDTLPSSVAAISVLPDSGVTCDTLTPAPGTALTCTVAPGFVGQRGVQISAMVAPGASGSVVNSVDASGADNPVCASCTVSNPVARAIDVAVANPRAFSAAGIPGTLIDIANMSSVEAASAVVTVTPASALRLFAAYAGNCTATAGADGSVSVSCPNPPSAQGIACSGSSCSLGSLPSNAAATLFVALNPGASATVTANVPGDSDTSDNSIVLPIGGTP